MLDSFYYVIYDFDKKLYVKDFDLFSVEYTDNLLNAFRFMDKECASACLSDFLVNHLFFRLKKVVLREYDIICRK